MSMPGFHAEAAVYNNPLHYAAALPAYEPFPRGLHAALGNGEGGSGCIPWSSCMPDKSSPTGCSIAGEDAQCYPIGWPFGPPPCRGCACPPGFTNCTFGCVDLKGNSDNCGACGHTCSADQICSNGTCIACPPGFTNCNNACVNKSKDPSNCGSCGNVCLIRGSCSNGSCVCPPGFTDCNTECAPLSTDPNNCGSCGHSCPAGMVCNFGFCESFSKGSSSTTCDPDTDQCSTTQCTNINGECTGLNGPRSCIPVPGGGMQCCDSNIFFGENPWLTVCTSCNSTSSGQCLSPPVSLSPSQGCGVCY
jgi:hypothetical protein